MRQSPAKTPVLSLPQGRNSKISKILITADPIGGVWTYALTLAQELATEGIEVAIATMGGSLSPDQRQQVHTIPRLEVYESQFKLEWMADPWTEIEEAGVWLLDLEAEIQPDIVHLNQYTPAALPWQAPTLVVGHSCVLSWWQAVKGEPAPPAWERYHQNIQQGLRAADQVVAPSQAMLTSLEQAYGPLPPATVIANGCDGLPWLQSGEKTDLILSVGRLWDEAKNLAALENIAPALDWPIFVAGEVAKPDGESVSPRQVQCLGRLDAPSLATWFARAAIYALPARYEPFGLSILEAALGSCALVLGDIPSLRENWQGAALFVDPDDPAALQATLTRLIRDDYQRQQLARQARDRARQFSATQMAAQYQAIYSQLLSRSVPSSGEKAPCKS